MTTQKTKYKLIDYPRCAICEEAEWRDNNTFICMYNEGCEDYDPTPDRECEIFDSIDKIGIYYLFGFFDLMTKKIKRQERKIKRLKEEVMRLK